MLQCRRLGCRGLTCDRAHGLGFRVEGVGSEFAVASQMAFVKFPALW